MPAPITPNDGPPRAPAAAAGPAVALHLLATMWRIRLFEEEVSRQQRAGLVRGLVHLSVGQEAVAAGVCPLLRAGDLVYTGHRGHGHAIAKGVPMDRLLAELMGRADGVCRGLGGSMHVVDVEHGLMGATGVVAGNLPLAVGSALAARLRGQDQVTAVFFGDGAVQAGYFHESVNLATLWRLPVVFVCENNGFAEFTPRSAHTVVERVSDVVAPYGLTRETVDGNDVLAVRDAASALAAAAGAGPALLECLTHRLRGHYEGDPQKYREAISQAEWQEKDPIAVLRRRGLASGWFTEEETLTAERTAAEAVAGAVRFASASAFPPADLMEQLVYAPAEAP
ncbi:MAG TPA: thiamine pyrophosphate-dependent dehydrogenase E1 component subunit alpha [Streptosporangiaceae bacterium]|nr:thiamine pyrophosphate-dependent dehydrogenase E1 component subunit alpha [Streptosporangiaceae bacterium]